MAANSPDAPLGAAEIRELRRLAAARSVPVAGPGSLTVTLVGVFAAGFLGLIGWMGYETMESGKAVTGLRTDVAVLKADVRELKNGQKRLEAGQAELGARLARLEGGQEETSRKLDRLLTQRGR